MKKEYLSFALKTLVVTGILLFSYYRLLLKPKLELPNKLLRAEEMLIKQKSILTQNRLAFVEITRLNPESAGFELEGSDLFAELERTREEALKEINESKEIPGADNELSNRYPELISETADIYERQKNLLEKVYDTESYGEGVEIIKSDESIEILTDQTNLILEYEYFLQKINGKQEDLDISKGIKQPT